MNAKEEKKVTLEGFLKNPSLYLKKIKFEEGVKILEELVETLQSGEFPLEEAIDAYEKGMKLVSCLREKLSAVETRLKVLQLEEEKNEKKEELEE
ncbi:MAG: exodeoxyribonuclease VII small subunit [Candidatus Dadabacteria bacterium]|nr:MAG: exodeoxyribonuclease VII small subunit [Candidatus Dadabacteria bacterium]